MIDNVVDDTSLAVADCCMFLSLQWQMLNHQCCVVESVLRQVSRLMMTKDVTGLSCPTAVSLFLLCTLLLLLSPSFCDALLSLLYF